MGEIEMSEKEKVLVLQKLEFEKYYLEDQLEEQYDLASHGLGDKEFKKSLEENIKTISDLIEKIKVAKD